MNLQLLEQIKTALQDTEHQYYFDKINIRIVVISKWAKSYDNGDFQACEIVNIERNPNNFVQIDSISDMDEFEWMNDFCAEIGNPEKLYEALSSSNVFGEFQKYIEKLDINDKWQAFYKKQVEIYAQYLVSNYMH